MVLRRAFREYGLGRDMGIGAAIALISLGLQVWWELIPLKDWQEHKWQCVISVGLTPFYVPVFMRVGWYCD